MKNTYSHIGCYKHNFMDNNVILIISTCYDSNNFNSFLEGEQILYRYIDLKNKEGFAYKNYEVPNYFQR